MNSYFDCIAAIATPPGKGGVSVIRISGEGAMEVAEKIFRPKSGKKLSEHPKRMQIYGDVIKSGSAIDDALACCFEKNSSFTGEETVEISCHGGVLITRCVLEAAFSAGARPACKGEFTKRAFINGKITLTGAEAIGNLLDAKSEEQIKLSSFGARQRLDDKLCEIKKAITDTLSSAYARIDYPDEDLGDFTTEELTERIGNIKDSLVKLASTYRTGRAINEGISTVICGKPNVGKSSIYNLLLGEDAAIVTDIGGTTRDVLEKSIPLGRIILKLADTAGIRESTDVVESIGIERSRERMNTAELILAVFDTSRPLDFEDDEIISALSSSSGAKIGILNKSDLKCKDFDESKIKSLFSHTIEISAKFGDSDAVANITELVEKLFTDGEINTENDAIISSARQFASLTRAIEFISYAKEALDCGICQDAASSDIERALAALSEIDGRQVSEDVVNDIFAKFCVGK